MLAGLFLSLTLHCTACEMLIFTMIQGMCVSQTLAKLGYISAAKVKLCRAGL